MKDIKKNRFLVWLMWAPAFWCIGCPALIGWTLVQFLLLRDEKEERSYYQLPMEDRPDIIEMNKPENLTEDDKLFFSCHIQYTKEKGYGWIKVREGCRQFVKED